MSARDDARSILREIADKHGEYLERNDRLLAMSIKKTLDLFELEALAGGDGWTRGVVTIFVANDEPSIERPGLTRGPWAIYRREGGRRSGGSRWHVIHVPTGGKMLTILGCRTQSDARALVLAIEPLFDWSSYDGVTVKAGDDVLQTVRDLRERFESAGSRSVLDR